MTAVTECDYVITCLRQLCDLIGSFYSIVTFWQIIHCSLQTKTNKKQESRAMAKMTARCTLRMGPVKNFDSPWVRPRLLLPKFLIGVCSDRSYECAY